MIKRILLFGLLLFYVFNTYASSLIDRLNGCHYARLLMGDSCKPVLSFTAGLALIPHAAGSKSYFIDQSNYDLNASGRTESTAALGIYDGIWIPINPFWSLQSGLRYQLLTPFYAKGHVTQGVDPQSTDRFKYHYRIFSQQLLVEGKLYREFANNLHPYLLLGLGISYNKTKHYHVEIPDFITFSPVYKGNENFSFSYALGIGIDMDLPCGWRLGGGYRFLDIGKTKLKNAHINTVPISGNLEKSNIYAHKFLAEVSYFFA